MSEYLKLTTIDQVIDVYSKGDAGPGNAQAAIVTITAIAGKDARALTIRILIVSVVALAVAIASVIRTIILSA